MRFMWFFGPFLPFLLIMIGVGVITRIVRTITRGGGRFPGFGGWDRSSSRFNSMPQFFIPGQQGEARIAPEQKKQKGQESTVFKIAYKMRGRLTVTDLVLETNMDVAEAEKLLEGMVDSTHVRMEVTDRGTVVYEFPEIMDRCLRDGETGRLP